MHILSFIFLQSINPSNAIANLGLNYGVLGVVAVLLIWYVIRTENYRTKESRIYLDALNKERLAKDKESQEADKRFIEYLQRTTQQQFEIIKKNSDAFIYIGDMINEFLNKSKFKPKN